VRSVFVAAYKSNTEGSANIVGSSGGLQQATLTWGSPTCQSIYDPYGVVRDADTLQPVAGAKVTLLVKRNGVLKTVTAADISALPDLFPFHNPLVTNAQGEYAFLVPDGTYYLRIQKDGYVFYPPSRSDGLQYPLYDGKEVVQQGTPVRRDVMLKKAIPLARSRRTCQR
jgi:hypothetical protein